MTTTCTGGVCLGIIDVDLDSENVSLVLNKATRFVVAVLLTGFGNIYALDDIGGVSEQSGTPVPLFLEQVVKN